MHLFVPSDTLLERERVTRTSLRPWAERLLARLDTLTGRINTDIYIIASCLNNAALIEVFRGDLIRARELCEIQLAWLDCAIARHGFQAVGGLVTQPWINLGRLRRMNREFAEALSHFARLDRSETDNQVIAFGPIVIDMDTWTFFVEARSMAPFLDGTHAVESTRTFFVAEDFRGAAEFCRCRREIVCEPVLPYIYEAELISLFMLENFVDAMDLVMNANWGRDAYSNLVRVTYRVVISAATSAESVARSLLKQLVDRVLRMNLDGADDQRVLRYISYLGGLADRALLMDEAGLLWRQGLRVATHQGDILFELSCLEALIRLEGQNDLDALLTRREALLRECLMKTIVEARGYSIDPIAAADPVFDALQDRIERVTRAP